MKLDDIKNPNDILDFMNENIQYGWLDIMHELHIGNMKNFRKLYHTMTIDDVLKYGVGTCIEQVYLMSILLNKLGIKNKMFCTRIYEGKDFNNLEEEEHMHCFVLYYLDDMVYHIEHPNFEKVGIYKYKSEAEALKKINEYYIDLVDGKARPITEFYKVDANMSFKEFNNYINSLDEYTCVIASLSDIEKKYDYEIKNADDCDVSNWKEWKKKAIDRSKKNWSITYHGILNGEIICECTAAINKAAIDDSEDLINKKTAYLFAFRTVDEYQGRGYFSKLFKFMIDDLKRRGYKKVTLGVEPKELKNRAIYEKYGFTKHIKDGTEEYPDGTLVKVMYYGKEI